MLPIILYMAIKKLEGFSENKCKAWVCHHANTEGKSLSCWEESLRVSTFIEQVFWALE